VIALMLTLACTGKDTTPSDTPTDSPPTETSQTTGTTETDSTGCTSPDPLVVDLTTRDDVKLVGDLYSHGGSAPGVVLLHMIPPNYQRTDWPRGFIDRLTAKCWNVIAIDRRGAGDSEGVAAEAYQGETGRYDVEAAVKRLSDEGLGTLGILGASNGTTSMLDYAVWAGSEGLPVPTALGYMTGGSYTESQNPMSAGTDWPAIFTYSTAERAWSVDQQALNPGSWAFHEYANGDHGTKMFAADPTVEDDLETFLAQHL